jgi:hypothetical protein
MTKTKTEAKKLKPEFVSILSGEIVEPKEGEKILKVNAKEIEYENKKFFVFNVIKKNGDKMQLKFTKAAKNIPVSEGNHFLLVNESDVNVDTWSKVYPVMWCKNVIDILHVDDKSRAEQKKEALNEF